jgi:hypothetical protein
VVLLAAACGDDGSAANPERFCEIAAELEEPGDDPFELPPDEARENLLEFQNLIEEAVSVAPDEIRSGVEEIAELNALVREFFEAADFDIADVDEAELGALFAEVEALSDGAEGTGLGEWIAANCSA